MFLNECECMNDYCILCKSSLNVNNLYFNYKVIMITFDNDKKSIDKYARSLDNKQIEITKRCLRHE